MYVTHYQSPVWWNFSKAQPPPIFLCVKFSLRDIATSRDVEFPSRAHAIYLQVSLQKSIYFWYLTRQTCRE